MMASHEKAGKGQRHGEFALRFGTHESPITRCNRKRAIRHRRHRGPRTSLAMRNAHYARRVAASATMSAEARDAVARRACELLAALYPGTTWAVALPDVGTRSKAPSALRQLNFFRAAPDDMNAIGDGKVARLALRTTHEDSLDAFAKQAA